MAEDKEPTPDGTPDEFEGGLVPSVPMETAPSGAAVAFEVTPEAAAQIREKLSGATTDEDTIRAVINQAMAARDAEISALRADLASVKEARDDGAFSGDISIGGFPWMYWKKPKNWRDESTRGWISTGPGGATPKGNRDTGSYSVYLRKGLIPVTRYGYIEPPTRPEAVEQFLPILRRGGAQEFPTSQVIAYKWHENPPIRGLTFPQYEAEKSGIVSFTCEACGHTLFFMPDQKAIAGESYRAHLMSGHKYPFREAAEAVRVSGLTLTSYRADPVAVGGGAVIS